MSQAVQRSNPPKSDQDLFYDNSKNYGGQGDYEKDLEGGAPEGGDFDPSLDGGYPGDGYVEDQGTPEPEGGYTANDLRSFLSDLKQLLASTKDVQDRSKISAEIKKIEIDINKAVASGDPNVFASIMADITHVEAELLGRSESADPMNPDAPADSTVDLTELKKEIEKAIRDIDGRTNLTDDEKVELKAPLEKHLTEIKLAKDDPSKVDADGIRTDLDEAKTNTDQQDAYSPALKGLADKFDNMSEEQIKLKAEAKGIDLDNLSLPPSQELLNFLTDLSPDLKEAFKKVETAVSERIKSIQDNKFKMEEISKSNKNKDTSGDCNMDVTPWENLFKLKHFQDEKSIAVASAMQELVGTLTPIFKALFPGEEVKAVEDNSPGGWEKAQGAYLVADKIQIGTMTIDLIQNTTGKMQSSTSADTDTAITFSELWGDGEGSGEWDPPALQTYGDAQPKKMDNEYKGAW